MLIPILIATAGLVLLFAGGEALIRGSAALAARLGLRPLIIGATVMAFGTSAPELLVAVTAAVDDHAPLAIGNVIGSNILNIGLILGITALICPLSIERQVMRFDLPVAIAVTALCVLLMALGGLSRTVGVLLVVGLLLYVLVGIRLSLRHGGQTEGGAAIPAGRHPLWHLMLVIAGLAGLIYGSRLLVESAVDVARQFGVPELIIGLTIVAFGTSLPELAACVAAAAKRSPDLAVGNVVGSNIFNLLGILGVTTIIAPGGGGGASALDLGVMLAFALALVPFFRTGFRLVRWEGAVLIAGYGVYLVYLWP